MFDYSIWTVSTVINMIWCAAAGDYYCCCWLLHVHRWLHRSSRAMFVGIVQDTKIPFFNSNLTLPLSEIVGARRTPACVFLMDGNSNTINIASNPP